MPKLVDHQERKAEILGAFFAQSVAKGLHNVTLRGVAAEAGVSLRQVQYYFGTKDILVQAGLDMLEEQSHRGVSERLAKLSDSSSALDMLLALFKEALPAHTNSRQFHLLWMSYAMLSLSNPSLLNATLLEGPNRLQSNIIEILERGVGSGELRDSLNVEIEAIILLGLINGLGTAVLLGQQSAEAATASFTHQIDRLRQTLSSV